jgi:hypothetical protein
MKQALLGYAKLNYLKADVKFGRFNVRPKVESEVTRMVESFRQGITRYMPGRLMAVGLPKSSVDPESLTDEPGFGGDDFKELRFIGAPTTITACSGQHRYAAMQVLENEFKKILDKEKLELGKAIEQMEKGKMSEEDVGKVRDAVLETQGELELLGFWGVAVYDMGKVLCSTGCDD